MKTTFRITIAMIVMAFVFSFLIPNVTYAQKATFKNCSLEQNVKDQNGKKKMIFHFSADFTGMKKHDAEIWMEIECPKGTTHEYLDDDEGGEGRLRLPVRKLKEFKNKYLRRTSTHGRNARQDGGRPEDARRTGPPN